MSSSKAGPSQTSWSGIPQYHESAEEMDRIRRRKEIRMKLKAEFNRLHYNPYKLAAHVEILDPSVQRFMSMRATYWQYWKPSWRSFAAFACTTILPIWLLGRYWNWQHAKFDAECRTGEITVRMRKVLAT